ncbi:Bestrophin, RFP-TM, chloride channel-domain-containing protein [Rhizoctonia solani]|nr:Bestrophin, RFP-TM, chloride channel-domain-containing protein [Rhizoctonia solani]
MERQALPTPHKRSFNGHHDLLPSRGQSGDTFISPISINRFSVWSFGRGTVIWRIWPAVLLHTLVAAAVVFVSHRTSYNLAIPNVLVTVTGVVIGFVISYRTSSGYDRYWQGRTLWSDMIKNSRTIGRLIWLHVPNSISKSSGDLSEKEREKESKQALLEKREALRLIQGFAVAVKHHLRGETGIYYEDLYYLVSTVSHVSISDSIVFPIDATFQTASRHQNSYGTFQNPDQMSHNLGDPGTPLSPTSIEPLLPASRPSPSFPPPSLSLTPFTSILIPFTALLGLFSWVAVRTTANPHDDVEHGTNGPTHAGNPGLNFQRKLAAGGKYYPLVAGESEFNLPLAILRRLSEWVALLENRGSTGGSVIGGMLGCVAAFEDQLTALEKILTTPLPFVYSVHIRHTVWLYLFFLPFQLTGTFGYWTIFGVGIAAFMFLGLLAAGEEIEQPFGYDENDLDLDLFVTEIIQRDLHTLTEMWPYESGAKATSASGQSEIRRVVDTPINLGDESGVNEQGHAGGDTRVAERVGEI